MVWNLRKGTLYIKLYLWVAFCKLKKISSPQRCLSFPTPRAVDNLLGRLNLSLKN